MTESRRKRGRPRGPKHNDDALLVKIADLKIEQPYLGISTAVKRLVPDWSDAIIRRIQDRWQKTGERFLTAAQERKTAASSRSSAIGRQPTRGIADSLADAYRSATLFGESYNGSAHRMAMDVYRNPAYSTARDLAKTYSAVAAQADEIRKAMASAAAMYDPFKQLQKELGMTCVQEIMEEQQRMSREAHMAFLR